MVSTRPSRHLCLFHHLCLLSQLLSPHPSRIPNFASLKLSTPYLQPPCNCLTRYLQENRSIVNFCSSPDKVTCISSNISFFLLPQWWNSSPCTSLIVLDPLPSLPHLCELKLPEYCNLKALSVVFNKFLALSECSIIIYK